MAVTRDEVRRIAALARIGVDESRIPALVAELDSILEHMRILQSVDTKGVIPATGLGAGGTPLREDAGPPIPLVRPLEDIAPRMHHGFFLVPRLDTHAAGGSEEEEA